MDKESLKKEIGIEMENLNRLNKEMNMLLRAFSGEPDSVERRAAGSILHDFYSEVEKFFKRIAVCMNGALPKSRDWHTELLLKMAKSMPKFRGSVLDQALLEKLKEYLRFRHLFRHMYGFELKWDLFKHLALSLKSIVIDLQARINIVFSFLWSYLYKKILPQLIYLC